MKQTALFLLLIAALLFLGVSLAGAAGRQGSTAMDQGYDLSWHVVAGGGGQGQAAPYALGGTAGQGVVGAAGQGPYALCSGFWCGPERAGYPIYLPLVVKGAP